MRTLSLWLSFALIFTIPLENAITFTELGTMTKVVGLLTATVWMVSLLLTRKFRAPHPFQIVASLFILWNILSIFWSVAVAETLQQIKTYVQLGIMVFILWDLYTETKHLTAALQSYILGAYVAIASTIFNYLAGHEISAYSEGRYAGAGANAVDLVLVLSLGLPVAWHLATSAGNKIRNYPLTIVNYAYIPAAFFAILVTGSRTALFTVVPAVLYILRTTYRTKFLNRLLILAIFVCALLILQLNIPQPTLERLGTTRDSIAAGDLGGRGKLWGAAFAHFSEHPLFGLGSGALHSLYVLDAVAHNTFLSLLAELGLIGFSLFAFMLAIVARQLVKKPISFSILWISVLAIWAIGVFTLSWEFRKPTWLFLSFVLISTSLYSESNQPDYRLRSPVNSNTGSQK